MFYYIRITKVVLFSVLKPNSVNFVDAVCCIGEGVKTYIALHYLGRLVSGDTG